MKYKRCTVSLTSAVRVSLDCGDVESNRLVIFYKQRVAIHGGRIWKQTLFLEASVAKRSLKEVIIAFSRFQCLSNFEGKLKFISKTITDPTEA